MTYTLETKLRALAHNTMSADPLATLPQMTPREMHDTELCHAFASSACQMVEWIRHCDAPAKSKREALSRIGDVTELHLTRLRSEGGLWMDCAKEAKR